MLPLDQIHAVRPIVMEAAIRTPLLRFRDSNCFLKLENLQPIGAFKLRGAHAQIHEFAPQAVITASAGNMARAVAWCARRREIPCTVVVPENAPRAKTDPVQQLGGQVIRVDFDRWWQTFVDRSYPGIEACFIHPFDHPMMLAGNATIGLEILEDLPEVDNIVIPWGGGGLCCGIASAIRQLKPDTKIYAAEVETAAPLTASWQAGAPSEASYEASFVDGIGAKRVFPEMFARARELIDGTLLASLPSVREAIRDMAQHNKVIAEGAGACPLAVARELPGRTACVVSGGNIDHERLNEILS